MFERLGGHCLSSTGTAYIVNIPFPILKYSPLSYWFNSDNCCWRPGGYASIYLSPSLVLDQPQPGVHLLAVLVGLTMALCIVVVSSITHRMYNLPLPQSHVPSQRSCGSSPSGSTSGPNNWSWQPQAQNI